MIYLIFQLLHRNTVARQQRNSAARAASGFQAQGLEGVFGPYVSQT